MSDPRLSRRAAQRGGAGRKGNACWAVGIAQALTTRAEFFEARGDFIAPVVGRGIDRKIAERGTNFGRRRRCFRAIGGTQARVAKTAQFCALVIDGAALKAGL